MKSAAELENYTKGEEEKMETFIKEISESGVKVVVGGGSISDIALHFLQKYQIMVLKILSKFELRRFSKSLGGALLVRHVNYILMEFIFP